jgi:hypothetical protein
MQLSEPNDYVVRSVLGDSLLATRDKNGESHDFAVLPQCGDGVRHGQHDRMIIGRNEIGVQHMIKVFAEQLGVALS